MLRQAQHKKKQEKTEKWKWKDLPKEKCPHCGKEWVKATATFTFEVTDNKRKQNEKPEKESK